MSASQEIIRDLSALVGGSILVKAIGACVTKVPPEHAALREHSNRAIRRRNTLLTRKKAGELYQLRGPGTYASALLRSYKVVSLQSHVSLLEEFAIHSDNEQLTVRSAAEWGVALDPRTGKPHELAAYRMAYRPKDEHALREGVIGMCGTALRNVMMQAEDPKSATSGIIYPLVKETCESDLKEKFGIELRDLYFLEGAETIVSAIGKKALKTGLDPSDIVATGIDSAGNGNGALHVVGESPNG